MAVTYPCYWEKKESNGQWCWVYYAESGEPVSRSVETYPTRTDCERGISLMRHSADDPIFYAE